MNAENITTANKAGSFLYAANNGSSTISAFAIDPKTGTLVPCWIAIPSWPGHFRLHHVTHGQSKWKFLFRSTKVQLSFGLLTSQRMA